MAFSWEFFWIHLYIIIWCSIFWVLQIKTIFCWFVNHDFKDIMYNVLHLINILKLSPYHEWFIILWIHLTQYLIPLHYKEIRLLNIFKILILRVIHLCPKHLYMLAMCSKAMGCSYRANYYLPSNIFSILDLN